MVFDDGPLLSALKIRVVSEVSFLNLRSMSRWSEVSRSGIGNLFLSALMPCHRTSLSLFYLPIQEWGDDADSVGIEMIANFRNIKGKYIFVQIEHGLIVSETHRE